MILGARRALLRPKKKTYQDFVAHITARATGGAVGWNTGGTLYAGSYRTTASTTSTGDMYGSPWLTHFGPDLTPPSRVVQHGLPSQAEATAQRSAGRQIFLRITDPGPQASTDAVLRNGYQSLDSGGPYNASRCEELLFWNDTLQIAQKMNPYAGTGPEYYPL